MTARHDVVALGEPLVEFNQARADDARGAVDEAAAPPALDGVFDRARRLHEHLRRMQLTLPRDRGGDADRN